MVVLVSWYIGYCSYRSLMFFLYGLADLAEDKEMFMKRDANENKNIIIELQMGWVRI